MLESIESFTKDVLAMCLSLVGFSFLYKIKMSSFPSLEGQVWKTFNRTLCMVSMLPNKVNL